MKENSTGGCIEPRPLLTCMLRLVKINDITSIDILYLNVKEGTNYYDMGLGDILYRWMGDLSHGCVEMQSDQ